MKQTIVRILKSFGERTGFWGQALWGSVKGLPVDIMTNNYVNIS